MRVLFEHYVLHRPICRRNGAQALTKRMDETTRVRRIGDYIARRRDRPLRALRARALVQDDAEIALGA